MIVNKQFACGKQRSVKQVEWESCNDLIQIYSKYRKSKQCEIINYITRNEWDEMDIVQFSR